MPVDSRRPFAILTICSWLGVVVGCALVGSRADVIGRYELDSKNGKIVLDLHPNGNFEETVVIDSAVADRRSGTWKLIGHSVDLDQLWIPREFAPKYIIGADAASAPENPKYTAPGHWALGAEKHLGRVVLAVFPDADVNFEKVKAH